jgi:putative transposase
VSSILVDRSRSVLYQLQLRSERHLKMTIKEWGLHYNRGRPHSSLGPGIPEPNQDRVPASNHRHKLPAGYRVMKMFVLGGLHHEYRLVKEAA